MSATSSSISSPDSPSQSQSLSLPLHRRARSQSQSTVLSSPLRRFSFLSLTPSPKATDHFAHLIDTQNKGSDPIFIFEQHSPVKLVEPRHTKSAKFILPKFTMPSWGVSSKSSASKSRSNKARREYMPQPFFNAVAEYQLINGGNEKSAIAAILRERGLNMSVEEAIACFGNETVSRGGNTAVNSGVYRDEHGNVWMDQAEALEYTHLLNRNSDSEDTSSIEGDDGFPSRPSFKSHSSMGGVRRRPAPLNLAPSHHQKKYGFEDSFVPTPASTTTYRSSIASTSSNSSTSSSSTLVSPTAHHFPNSTKSVGGVKALFKLGRK